MPLKPGFISKATNTRFPSVGCLNSLPMTLARISQANFTVPVSWKLFLTVLCPALLVCFAAQAGEGVFENLTLRVPEGYKIERVAAPPLVDRPVNMAFDESGALYVTDSSGTNERPVQQLKNPSHRILKLTDSIGDGRFDRRTVFVDHISFPEGAMWLDGSLYVAAPPVIWKFTDTTGRGVADKREVWFDGGTVTGCANDLHGPYAGPDGYIYWCKGAFAEQHHALANGRKLITRASHIFRARPDGSGREVVLTGGMDNPVDVAFSRTGQRFLSGTFFVKPGAGFRDGILHAVYGGVWGKEHGVLEGHPRTGELLPVMTQLGPAAPCGLELLRSSALGHQGALLCAQFNLRKVSLHQLVPEGATFRTQDSSLVESSNPDFHPTDVIEDADGSILVADTGGWYKICCPTSKELKPEVLGAIYRISRNDAPPAADPRGLKLEWKNASASDLSARLADPRHEVATRAAQNLVQRGEVLEIAGLLARGGSREARLNALWVLIRIQSAAARAAVRSALMDKDPDVQMLSVYGTGLWRDSLAAVDLRHILDSPDPHLSRSAAEALGRMGDKASIAALLRTAPSERFGFHTTAYALFETGDAAAIAAAAAGSRGPSSAAAEVALAMLSLPQPPSIPALPLVMPAAPQDPAFREQQFARLHELLAFLKTGNAQRGELLFKSERSLCTSCHAVSGVGGNLGPDLTKVGAIRTATDLMEAVVFPSNSFVRSYEPLLVRLRSGVEHYGILRDETLETMRLATGPATEIAFLRKDVGGITEGAMSLMPPGFDALLAPQELADLVTYLLTLR